MESSVKIVAHSLVVVVELRMSHEQHRKLPWLLMFELIWTMLFVKYVYTLIKKYGSTSLA